MGNEKNTFHDLDGTLVPDLEVEEEKKKHSDDDKKILDDPEDEPEDDEGADEDEEPSEEEDDEDVEVLRTKNAELEERVAAAERGYATIEAEMKGMTLGKLQNEKKQIEALVKEFETGITKTREELIQAKKDGDADAEAVLSDRLDQFKDAARESKELAGKLVQQLSDAERTAPAKGQKPIPPLTQRWLSNNQWFNDGNHVVEHNTARGISEDVAKKIPPNTEKHFEEVNRRLAEMFPKLTLKSLSGTAVARGKRKIGGNGKKSPVDGGRTSGSNEARADAKRLSDLDRATMTAFKMDPTDKRQVAVYLDGKLADARKAKE